MLGSPLVISVELLFLCEEYDEFRQFPCTVLKNKVYTYILSIRGELVPYLHVQGYWQTRSESACPRLSISVAKYVSGP